MMSFTKKPQLKIMNLLLAFAVFMLFVSCSSESFTQQDQNKDEGEQILTFTEKEDGKDVQYEINFKDGKIHSIYRDNIKVPDDEIEDYSELVYDELRSLRGHHKPYVFHFDADEFKENMEELRSKIKTDKLNFNFDKEEFKKHMQKLKEELKDMDEIVIKIDKDKIRNELDKIKIHKFNFDKDFNFDFDFDEHELNMEEFEKEMERLDEEMDDLSLEMEELNKEMKILDNFLKDVKNELVEDGFIKTTEDEINLELSKDEMKINGEKASSTFHEKYKELYKKHYNKEIDEKIKFQIN